MSSEETAVTNEDTTNTSTSSIESGGFEEEAKTGGWMPEADYKGPEGQWVAAKEFVARKPLYDKIRKQQRRIKTVEASNVAVSDHLKKVKSFEYDRALADIKSQKLQALEKGDHVSTVELDDKMADLKATRQTEVASAEQEQQELFGGWLEENSWYKEGTDVQDYADGRAAIYRQNNPEATPMEVLDHIKEKAQAMFPNEFENKTRQAAVSVEGQGTTRTTRPSEANSKFRRSDLNSEQKTIMDKMIRGGAKISEKDYIQQLGDMGELQTQRS